MASLEVPVPLVRQHHGTGLGENQCLRTRLSRQHAIAFELIDPIGHHINCDTSLRGWFLDPVALTSCCRREWCVSVGLCLGIGNPQL